jgi:hypothetical protein
MSYPCRPGNAEGIPLSRAAVRSDVYQAALLGQCLAGGGTIAGTGLDSSCTRSRDSHRGIPVCRSSQQTEPVVVPVVRCVVVAIRRSAVLWTVVPRTPAQHPECPSLLRLLEDSREKNTHGYGLGGKSGACLCLSSRFSAPRAHDCSRLARNRWLCSRQYTIFS